MSVNDFLLDFAVASVFIMIGQFLRAKVGFIQRFFIPASMLAGFMGLAFRYVFPGFLPMSDSIGSYPGMLIMVIFAAVGINGFTMNKGGWFERALFVFGYSTGVFAIGFILLRIVDPENKSLTLNDTAFACIFTTFSELFTWSFGPMMLLNGQHWLFIGIQLAIMAVCIIVNLVMKWWWIKLPLTRPAVGEDEG